MKPRIKRVRGVWHCYMRGSGSFHTYCGLGMTPSDAWVDWALLQIKGWRAQA
jgi:hypothetical protein